VPKITLRAAIKIIENIVVVVCAPAIETMMNPINTNSICVFTVVAFSLWFLFIFV
jgi:hypothetical protein